MPGKRVSVKISDIKWRLSIISPFAESIIIFRHIKTIVNRRLVSRFRKKKQSSNLRKCYGLFRFNREQPSFC